LDGNDSASKSDFESKMQEVEGKAQPIMMKIYQSGEGPSASDFGSSGPSAGSSSGSGPTVEEVD